MFLENLNNMPFELTHHNLSHALAYQIPPENVFHWWEDYLPDTNWEDTFATLLLKLRPPDSEWVPLSKDDLLSSIKKQLKVAKIRRLLPRVYAVLSHVDDAPKLPVIDANLLFFKTTREHQLSQARAIVYELLPIIDLCENGMLERLNTIWNRWTTQDSIEHILIAIRHDIVRMIGLDFIKKDRITSELESHELDCYYMAAEAFGFGVHATRGFYQTPMAQHLDRIERNFIGYYTPLGIIESICNYMMGRCNDLLISSCSVIDESSVYLPDTLVRTVEYFNTILNTTLGLYDFFLTNLHGEPNAVDWRRIRFEIHQSLVNMNIIKKPLFNENGLLQELDLKEFTYWFIHIAKNINQIHYLNTNPEFTAAILNDNDFESVTDLVMTLFKDDAYIFDQQALHPILWAAAKSGDIIAAEKIRGHLLPDEYHNLIMTPRQGLSPLERAIKYNNCSFIQNHQKYYPQCLTTICIIAARHNQTDILIWTIKMGYSSLLKPHDNIYHQLIRLRGAEAEGESSMDKYITLDKLCKIPNKTSYIFHKNHENKTPLDLAAELNDWCSYSLICESEEYVRFPGSSPAMHLQFIGHHIKSFSNFQLQSETKLQSVINRLVDEIVLSYKHPHLENSGDTLAHDAIRQENGNMLICLLAHPNRDALFSIRNIVGETPLETAIRFEKRKMLQYIRGVYPLNPQKQLELFISLAKKNPFEFREQLKACGVTRFCDALMMQFYDPLLIQENVVQYRTAIVMLLTLYVNTQDWQLISALETPVGNIFPNPLTFVALRKDFDQEPNFSSALNYLINSKEEQLYLCFFKSMEYGHRSANLDTLHSFINSRDMFMSSLPVLNGSSKNQVGSS